MRIFWKQFAKTICLLMLMFAIFGGVLLYSSFQMSIEENKSRVTQDIAMLQYAVLSSIQSLPDDYEAVDYAVAQIGESITGSMHSSQTIVHIYRKDGTMIYSSGKTRTGELQFDAVPQTGAVYEILEVKGGYVLQSLSCLESGRGAYYIQMERDISDIYVNREALYQRYCLILVGAVAVSAILTILSTAGITRPILRLSRQTERFAQGDYSSRVAVCGDDEITQLMKDFNEMADRLEENMQKLQEDAHRQEEFTASFAHELKTPLTSIVGYGDMLRSMQMPQDDVQMCGAYIFEQGTRLERLSYKMMELVGMNRQCMEWRTVAMRPLLERAVQMTAKGMQDRYITCKLEVEDGNVRGEEDLLLSLVCNLLDNSRKACAADGVIYLRGRCADTGYVVEVQDNGRGIPKEDIERIKEAFYMVDKSRARKEGGAGIGMALCERIVSLHHAKWTIESEEGKGTLVRITFEEEQHE